MNKHNPKSFSEVLEQQVRAEVRAILNGIFTEHLTQETVKGQHKINIDITEAENKLVKLAVSMY